MLGPQEFADLSKAVEQKLKEPAYQAAHLKSVQQIAANFPSAPAPGATPSPVGTPATPLSGPPPVAAAGSIYVETFWWGFHIVIPEPSLQNFLAVGTTTTALVAALGAHTGPAAPYIEVAAALMVADLAACKLTDKGYGIYWSMSWFAPGVFVPTPIGPNDGVNETAPGPVVGSPINGVFKIISVNSQMVLDVPGASPNDGVQIQQYTDNNQRNQQWKIWSDSAGYAIGSVSSEKVLDVRGASTSDGAAIQQYTDHGQPNQRWNINAQPGGYYTIQSKGSGLLLDVPNASRDAGVLIQQYQSTGGDNQHWLLVPVA